MDPTASIIISAALIFYTIGVWSERISNQLKPWHVVYFFLGLIFDTWGTGLMLEYTGGLTSDVHGVSGLIAILLMVLHAAWATLVLVRKDQAGIRNFHKFSVAVWFIWLIPYFSPMFFQIMK